MRLFSVKGPSKGEPSGTLVLRAESLNPAHVKNAIENAQTAVATSGLRSVDKVTNLASGLKVLATALGRIVKLGDELSQVRRPAARVRAS